MVRTPRAVEPPGCPAETTPSRTAGDGLTLGPPPHLPGPPFPHLRTLYLVISVPLHPSSCICLSIYLSVCSTPFPALLNSQKLPCTWLRARHPVPAQHKAWSQGILLHRFLPSHHGPQCPQCTVSSEGSIHLVSRGSFPHFCGVPAPRVQSPRRIVSWQLQHIRPLVCLVWLGWQTEQSLHGVPLLVSPSSVVTKDLPPPQP